MNIQELLNDFKFTIVHVQNEIGL